MSLFDKLKKRAIDSMTKVSTGGSDYMFQVTETIRIPQDKFDEMFCKKIEHEEDLLKLPNKKTIEVLDYGA